MNVHILAWQCVIGKLNTFNGFTILIIWWYIAYCVVLHSVLSVIYIISRDAPTIQFPRENYNSFILSDHILDF